MNPVTIIEIAIVVIAILAFALYLVWQIKKKGLRQTAISLIVKAEDMFKQGENENKINYVIDKIIALIPAPLSFFITREAVREFIQTIFDEVKKALDYVPKEG
nr:MAG TPA: holin [Caudoviricetes sp.]